MEDFILSTAEKIYRDAPKRSFFKDIRASCDALILKLRSRPADVQADSDANKYFYILREAMDTKHPRLLDTALDAITFLVESEYLNGDETISERAKGDLKVDGMNIGSLMDLIVYKVCVCADENDDNRHTRVLRAIAAMVTAPHCAVHENTLLFCVTTCFQIALMSKSSSTRTAAEKTILSIYDLTAKRLEEKHAAAVIDGVAEVLMPMEGMSMSTSVQRSIVAEGDESDTAATEAVAAAMADVSAVSEGTCITSASGDGAVNGVASEDEGLDKQRPDAALEFASIEHKDMFVLFRHICALSMKGHQEDVTTQTDAVALQSKALSLEVVLHILRKAGPCFKTTSCFIVAVQRYLCVSLLGNCTSQVAAITGLSLHIFGVLMGTFKEHLKHELEVFITNIFLRILESENSSFDHKKAVLEVFHALCNDHEALVEIFINYDCDLNEIDLFRRIIDALAKIAKNPMVGTAKGSGLDFMSSRSKQASEERTVRAECLTALVGILLSLSMTSNLKSLEARGVDDLERLASDDLPTDGLSDTNSPGPSVIVSPSPSNGHGSNKGGTPTAATSAEEVVETFDRKKKLQSEIETGILKFNLSPRKGIAFLADLGHVENTPRGVAKFMHMYNDRLDKTVVGEYLGRDREYMDGFCIKVLHEFVDDMDFSGMLFDDAIRHYLSKFRLPGEAQKIDRLMENFAERFFLQNPGIFASADMAFILAFSTIMLQTNLHNPAIRDDKRMTKEQFLRQNKGISTDGEIPDDMLLGIYDRIAKNKIALHGEQDKGPKKALESGGSSFGFRAATRRKSAYHAERQEMVRASEAMFRERSKRRKSDPRARQLFQTGLSRHEQYLRPMLEVAWPAMLAVFSQVLESSDDSVLTDLCLDGVEQLISLCARLDLPVGRNAFVNCLCSATTLDSIKALQPKNIEAVKRLLGVALAEGDYLGENWLQVLQCISQLSRLVSMPTSTSTRVGDDPFKGSPPRRSSARRESTNFTKLFSGPTRAETLRSLEEANADVVARELESVDIEKIFGKSTSFHTESICALVEALCEVSLVEIRLSPDASRSAGLRGTEADGGEAPRVFSLQKLVEVSDSNMFTRSRLEWTRMWAALATHFSAVGLHRNLTVAMCAIDALKQLSIKFLQKQELSNFNFQRLFLKPFETILGRSSSREVQELVLGCLDLIVRSYCTNMRSGWRTILSTFAQAAGSTHEGVVELGFGITEHLLQERLPQLLGDFQDVVTCLTAFAQSKILAIAKKSLTLLAEFAVKLAMGQLVAPSQASTPTPETPPASPAAVGHSPHGNAKNATTALLPPSPSPSGSASQSDVQEVSQSPADANTLRLWWPLLMALSSLVGEVRQVIRARALQVLRGILLEYPKIFSSGDTWALIFKGVLFPMCEGAKTDVTAQPVSRWPAENPSLGTNEDSWIATTAAVVFAAINEIFTESLADAPEMQVAILPDVMGALEGCIAQDTESLARLALRAYNDLILNLGGAPGSEGCIGEERPLRPALAAIVADRACACALANLVSDFGDAGSLSSSSSSSSSSSFWSDASTDSDLPALTAQGAVAKMLSHCPLRRRRRSMPSEPATVQAAETGYPVVAGDGSKITVNTPYGIGEVSAAEVGDGGVVAPRWRVGMAGWMAVLYTCDERVTTQVQQQGGASLTTLAARAETERVNRWRGFGGAAMTCMVVSLDMTRLMGEMIHVYFNSWTESQLSRFLDTLLTVHYLAATFNSEASLHLRTLLGRYGLMHFPGDTDRLPHMMEGEVQAVSQLIVLSYKVYREYGHKHHHQEQQPPPDSKKNKNKKEKQIKKEKENENGSCGHALAHPWVHAITHRVLTRYYDLATHSKMSMGTGTITGTARDDEALLAAYTSPAAMVLRAVTALSATQFKDNAAWLSPLIMKLVTVDDGTVRACVREALEKHVLPLALGATAAATAATPCVL